MRNAQTKPTAPAPAPAAPQSAAPPKGSPYAVLGSWGFVGSMLLMSIPIAGFIIMIVWAAGGTINHNRRNLARGYLLLIAILVVVYLLVIIYFVVVYGSIMPIYNNLWYL